MDEGMSAEDKCSTRMMRRRLSHKTKGWPFVLVPLLVMLSRRVGAQVSPDLDGIEFFSGCKRDTTGLWAYGLKVFTFDKEYSEELNVLSDEGFLWCLEMVRRWKPGGIMFG